MIISGSPDISLLQIEVKWDLSGTSPVIRLTNQSEGANLAGVSYAFTALSPSQTYITQGNIDNPNATGVWTSFVLSNTWPRPMNNIEFSGAPYTFFITIRDSEGNTYTTEESPQTASICRPFGNTQKSTNAFGVASSDVTVNCNQARVFFQDNTYHSYRGEEGTLVASTLQVMYPIDETGTIPDPFQISSYSTALVPISYSSPNYQFLQNTVYDYATGDNCVVRIKYQLLKTFAVYCNIDLMAVQCEISKLNDEIINGNCSNVQQAQNKLNAITPKFMLVVMGTLQPLLGIDVPKLIAEIEEIGGFDCNCCSVPTGIIPTNASIIDGYSFSINKLGGDITSNSSFSVNGSNITLNIGDVSYVIRMGLASPSDFSTSAINFTSALSGDGYTRTYYLNIDGVNFQRELLANIGDDAYSVNYLNSLININPNTLSVAVDGGCIFESTGCNYNYTLIQVPSNATYASLISIQVSNNPFPLSFQFNLTNIPALQTYLNTLGLGTFIVLNIGSNQLLIQTLNNPRTLGNLTYKSGVNNYIALLQKDCSSFVERLISDIIQDIIYYLCDITDAKVKTSQDYTITYIDPDTSTIKTQVIDEGASINDLLTEKLDADVDTINYIMSLNKLSCGNIKNLFPPNIFTMQSNDIILGTKGGGACSTIYPVELFTRMLELALFDVTAMKAFCNAVSFCANGQTCSPFSSYSLSTLLHSPADDLLDITATFINPGNADILSYQFRWARIDNTTNPFYFYGETLSSPYTIEDLDEGQYNVQVRPTYSDGRECSWVSLNTSPCEGVLAFNAVNGTDNETIDITYTSSSSKVKLIVNYPNGGSFSQIYPNSGSITFNVPDNTFGVYSLTLTPVCNEETQFIGIPTAPVLINIPNPPNSSVINDTGDSITGIVLSSPSLLLNINIGGLADSSIQEFYCGDGFASTVSLSFVSGTGVTNAILNTDSGSFVGILSGSIITFSNVTVSNSNGMSITINGA